MAKKTQITYDQATAEIESILARFRDERMSVDELAAQVQRATELIEFCRGRLRKAEEQIDRIVSDKEQ